MFSDIEFIQGLPMSITRIWSMLPLVHERDPVSEVVLHFHNALHLVSTENVNT